MLRKLIFLSILSLSLVLSAQETSKTGEQFAQEVDQKIPQLMQDFAIPGVAIVIIDHGEIVLEKCYGFADVAKGIKVTPQTGFNIGSISKTVSAWGIMKLVEQGKIDLDAPVESYLTRWKLPKSEFNSEEVTVRRLLSHTAGLSHGSISDGLSYDNLPTLVEWLNGKDDARGPLQIIIEPGTKWEYSGGGYAVLQLLIEEVSGQNFLDFMQTEVLDPLGMTNSSFIIDETILAASAIPYDRYGEQTAFGLYAVHAAAGFQSTLEDFSRFAFASLPDHKDHLKYNTVLDVETVRQMQEPQPNSQVWAWKYGLGYQSVHMGENNVYIGHSGSNNGWQASFRIEAATMTGFIVFTNGGGGDNICDPLFCELMRWKSNQTSWDECWRQVSIANKLQPIIEDQGLEAMVASYWALKKEQEDVLDFSESQLNNLGYHYMAKGVHSTAVAVFKLNIDAFPDAYNVYDSYGEALLAHGKKEKAIENYKRSIELNPSNDNGFQVLKGLGISREDLTVTVPSDHLRLLAGEYVHVKNTEWKIRFEEADGTLKGQDKDMQFTLTAFGNNTFLKEDSGSSVIFDSQNPNAITLKIKDQYDFRKVE